MELLPAVGVGVSDLHQAARAEVQRIVSETGGDVLAQSKLLIANLRERELIGYDEVEHLSRLAELDYQAATGKLPAPQAYLAARDIANKLFADPNTTPVMQVLASSAVGAYSATPSPDGSGAVVYAKAESGHWANRGALTGALIGGIWGPGGALVGGAVGGLVGDIADHCTKS